MVKQFPPWVLTIVVFKLGGKPMKNYIALTILALLTMSCAVLEGLFESLPAQFVQFTGLLTIICVGVFIGWTLKVQANSLKRN
jgi:hypothetical protein